LAITYDPDKDAANLAKHGISLALARDVLSNAVSTMMDNRLGYGEARFVTFGDVVDRLHVAVYTVRGDTVRAISVRKANSRQQRRHG
jgi:uncharacterized DUF497 family protein